MNAALNNQPNNIFDTLSGREIEVLMLMLKGKSPQEIAQILNVHSFTTGTYKSRLFQKLNVNNIGDLTQVARNYGL